MSDIIEDASPWQHCESLDSIQNSDTAFSVVCTTAGKQNARERERDIEEEYATHRVTVNKLSLLFLCFSFFAFEVISAPHGHEGTASDDRHLICLINAC